MREAGSLFGGVTSLEPTIFFWKYAHRGLVAHSNIPSKLIIFSIYALQCKFFATELNLE